MAAVGSGEGSEGRRWGIARGDEVARWLGLAEEGRALDPQAQRLPVDARDDAQRHQRHAEEGLALLKDTDLIPAATMQEAAQKIVSLVGND